MNEIENMTLRSNNNSMSESSKSRWSLPRDNVSLIHNPNSNVYLNTRKNHKENKKANVILYIYYLILVENVFYVI